jgi:hypothetical protein
MRARTACVSPQTYVLIINFFSQDFDRYPKMVGFDAVNNIELTY